MPKRISENVVCHCKHSFNIEILISNNSEGITTEYSGTCPECTERAIFNINGEPIRTVSIFSSKDS